ncbi:MAG: hypothetical protein IH851_00215 [Armatimonadetes bacterium]|nr:hypothetical protein [Armatimonadota bacterium]
MPEASALAFWVALSVSGVLAWPCLLFLRKIGSVGRISRHLSEGHQAKAGTPTMGGLFVVIGAAAGLLAASRAPSVVPVLVLLFGFAAIGFLDDFLIPKMTNRRGLGWLPKLAAQFAVVGVFIAFFGFSPETLLQAFFIVAAANAVNFADGLDWLASWLLIIALVPFVVYYLYVQGGRPELMAILSIAIIGGLIPFLLLNAPPARLFMGDLGALALGAAFGFIFSLSPWDRAAWPWVASLILILELVLVPVQIAAVKLWKRRIFAATPIHHAFEAAGWPESRVLWTFLTAQVVLSAAAVTEVAS